MLKSILIPITLGYFTAALASDAPRLSIETLDISERGIHLIKHFEGCVLAPYQDVGQKWTVGWGHLIRDNERDNLMKGVTQEQADFLFEQDVRTIAVQPLKSQVTVPLYQYEFDSLCSFVFNLGSANFNQSTLKIRLHEQKYAEAALQIPRWNKVAKKYCRGIFKRRMSEMLIFSDNVEIPDLLPEYNAHYQELPIPLKDEIVQIYKSYHSH
jgi:lysozyme